MVDCHTRDGAALAQYFSWLEDEIVNKGNKSITEISGATELEKIRRYFSFHFEKKLIQIFKFVI